MNDKLKNLKIESPALDSEEQGLPVKATGQSSARTSQEDLAIKISASEPKKLREGRDLKPDARVQTIQRSLTVEHSLPEASSPKELLEGILGGLIGASFNF